MSDILESYLFCSIFAGSLIHEIIEKARKANVLLKILNIHSCLCYINLYNVSVQKVKGLPFGTNREIFNPQPHYS